MAALAALVTAIKAQTDKLAGWEIKDTHAHANNI
ncbi:unnamed protein product, partial [marine sediment metagenome]